MRARMQLGKQGSRLLHPECSGTVRGRAGTRDAHCQATKRDIITASLLTASAVGSKRPAQAALVRYPARELNNKYILLRAGECLADADGITNTNPINKQSRYAELTSLGKRQIVNRVAPALEQMLSLESTWIWPSINNASYQTAEILTSALALGQSRIVPEYSFLDPRGLGALDGQPYGEVAPLLREGDASSSRWKPPVGYDGTPNDSVDDVMVRTRQVLSITETQYDDENIVFVAPDSTVLSVLQAAIMGFDLREHWRLEYRPAEMRLLELNANVLRDDSPRSWACATPPNCL